VGGKIRLQGSVGMLMFRSLVNVQWDTENQGKEREGRSQDQVDTRFWNSSLLTLRRIHTYNSITQQL